MYTSVNDQQIYYQKIGRGNDLVMLHGWANDVSSFWNVAQELKENFTVWLVDLPGFGRSETPKKPFTVSDYAETVKAFLEELKIKKPVILGHSHGGRTTIKLVAKHPDIAEKIILEDAAGIRPKKDTTFYILYVASKMFNFLLPEVWLFNKLRNRIRYWFYKDLESDYLSAGELKKTLVNVIKEDLSSDIKKIKTETLLIWGENDQNVESDMTVARRMYKWIAKSRLEVIENAGHHPHLDNPKLFVYWVKDFAS
jgi:pimeloyl-ACP methyl ester carboxylesterase